MSDGFNKAMLLGHLGQDPELRYTQSGQAILNLRLATNESYVDRDGERQSRTEWHTVVMWGKRGEALNQYLQKGSRIFVEGRIQTRSYEGRNGDKRYSTEVVATEIVLLGDGSRRGSQQQQRRSDPPPSNESPFDDPDDDIPF